MTECNLSYHFIYRFYWGYYQKTISVSINSISFICPRKIQNFYFVQTIWTIYRIPQVFVGHGGLVFRCKWLLFSTLIAISNPLLQVPACPHVFISSHPFDSWPPLCLMYIFEFVKSYFHLVSKAVATNWQFSKRSVIALDLYPRLLA